MRRILWSLVVLAMVMPASARAETGVTAPTVAIDNFVFTPDRLVIAAGTRVTWVNDDDIPHTVVGATGNAVAFKSPPLDTGDKFSLTFDRPGTYRYFCSIHPMMTGTVVVQ